MFKIYHTTVFIIPVGLSTMHLTKEHGYLYEWSLNKLRLLNFAVDTHATIITVNRKILRRIKIEQRYGNLPTGNLNQNIRIKRPHCQVWKVDTA